MTAANLLATLASAGCPPRVEGELLVFDADPPTRLVPFIRLLQTGLRSQITNRPWFGLDAAGRGVGPGFDGALNPASELPRGAALLCVAGDSAWARVPASAIERLAGAFVRPVKVAKPFAATQQPDRPQVKGGRLVPT